MDEKGEVSQPLILRVGDRQHCAEGFGAEGDGGAEDFVFCEAGEFAIVGGRGFAAVFGDGENSGAASGEFGAEGGGRGWCLGGDAAEDDDGFSGDVLEDGECEEVLGVARRGGGEGEAGWEGVSGGLSDGEGWDFGGGRGVSGCGFGGDEDGEMGGWDWGDGRVGEVPDNDGGPEEGLVSALRQFRREVLDAVERTGQPDGGGSECGRHWRIIL